MTAAAVSEVLREWWFELRDGRATATVARVEGAIEVLRRTGQLTDEIAELWRRRIETCPGHDDEGGRDWCSYCGNMPKATPTETDE